MFISPAWPLGTFMFIPTAMILLLSVFTNYTNNILGLVEEKLGFPGGSSGTNPPANTGDVRDVGLIPGLGRSSGGGHGNPLQYSCLENLMDRRPGGSIGSQRVQHH